MHYLIDKQALQIKAHAATSGNASCALIYLPLSQPATGERNSWGLSLHHYMIASAFNQWEALLFKFTGDSLFHLSCLLDESETRAPPLLIIRLMGWKKPNEFGLQIISRDMNIYDCARNCSHEAWVSSLGDSQTNAFSLPKSDMT